MIRTIKKLGRGSRGMEALQAVLLLGAGFLVVWGVMSLWESSKGEAQKNVTSIVKGTPGGN
jgi:hypothetical protein